MTQTTLFVVSGVAGSGKTTLACAWGRSIGAHVLDLDEVAEHVVAQARRTDPTASEWQINGRVRQQRYRALHEAVRGARARGPVIAVAPFTQEIADPAAWRDLVESMGGGPAHLVWLNVDPRIRTERIAQRGAVRDAGRMEEAGPGPAPLVEHVRLDAGLAVSTLVAELMSRFDNEAFEV